MIRRYKSYGLAAVGVGILSMVGIGVAPNTDIGYLFQILMALVFMVALSCAALFFTRAKGYPWGLGILVAASVFVAGLGMIALSVLLLLPDRPPPPAQHA